MGGFFFCFSLAWMYYESMTTKANTTQKIKYALILVCAFSFSFAYAQIPSTKYSEGLAFISGGVGEGESEAILAEAKQWPLLLELSQLEQGRGVWIFGAQIQILDAKQQSIFDAPSDGPYMLINLKPGQYRIQATYQGVLQTKTVEILADQPKKLSIFWK